MTQIDTEILLTDKASITRAVHIWQTGGLVAFPTETVYGLGADATNGHAVAQIYAAKGRPSFNPLIIHVADFSTAKKFALFNEPAMRLAQAFWPGPMSLVLPIKPDGGLSELVTAGLDTIAVRVPENPLAQKLLAEFGGAIAAPSANISGRISPTTAAHVLADLSGKIEAVIDGGPCSVGLESTIILPSDPPVLLRPGGLPALPVEQMLGETLFVGGNAEQPSSPGQLASHYAPLASLSMNILVPTKDMLWLGFGANCQNAVRNLSPNGDLHEAAANLFGLLHELDAMAKQNKKATIGVAPIPQKGLGIAINDRLKRAAA